MKETQRQVPAKSTKPREKLTKAPKKWEKFCEKSWISAIDTKKSRKN